MFHPLRRRPLVLVLAVVVAMAALAAPAVAGTWPAKPTNLRVMALTDTSLTVSAARSTHATSYRLWASTVKSDVFAPALSHRRAARRSATARTPQVTVTGLASAPGRSTTAWPRSTPATGASPTSG